MLGRLALIAAAIFAAWAPVAASAGIRAINAESSVEAADDEAITAQTSSLLIRAVSATSDLVLAQVGAPVPRPSATRRVLSSAPPVMAATASEPPVRPPTAPPSEEDIARELVSAFHELRGTAPLASPLAQFAAATSPTPASITPPPRVRRTSVASGAQPGRGQRLFSLDRFSDQIAFASQSHGVDEALLRAVIHAESAFNPSAVSRAGAGGLMQLMPATASRFGVTDRFDPAQSIDGGARYLSWLLDRYHGDLTLAAAAYNAGEGAVDRHGGVPPYRETKGYVAKVAQLFALYSDAIHGGEAPAISLAAYLPSTRNPAAYAPTVRAISTTSL